nr:uncharacterized protein LOC106690782 [Halyomorpha halys]
MRDKVRNLKKKYKEIIDWRNGTGAGLQEENREASIKVLIEKKCPMFHTLDEIFGEKVNIYFPYCYENEEVEDPLSAYSPYSPCGSMDSRSFAGPKRGLKRKQTNMISHLVEVTQLRTQVLADRLELDRERFEFEKQRIAEEQKLRKLKIEKKYEFKRLKLELLKKSDAPK